MDQIKIGKLITKKRLEKKLTQSELGDLIGVTDKAVSKWERGVNIPDIALIQPLSEILDISISELLSGEENLKEETKTVIDGIKFYNNKLKSKVILFIIPIIVLLFAVLSLFFISNYNQCRVYSIASETSDYKVHGYIIFNPDENIIILDKVVYQGELIGTTDEPYAKNIAVSLKVKEEIISRTELKDVNQYLSQKLNEKAISFEDTGKDKMKILKEANKEDIYLELEITNEQDEIEKNKIELNFTERFRNTRLLY